MQPNDHQDPSTDAPAARRIADLEAEVAFQADGLRELNEALASQQLELLALRREMRPWRAVPRPAQRRGGARPRGRQR